MTSQLNKAETAKVVEILNRILELELSGLVRYLHYSFMIFGHNRIPIVAWLRSQADESQADTERAEELRLIVLRLQIIAPRTRAVPARAAGLRDVGDVAFADAEDDQPGHEQDSARTERNVRERVVSGLRRDDDGWRHDRLDGHERHGELDLTSFRERHLVLEGLRGR